MKNKKIVTKASILHFFKKYAEWIIFVVLLILIVQQRWSSFSTNNSVEGTVVPVLNLKNPSATTELFPPIKANPIAAIFWNTWCTPCKLEMDRLQRSVNNGTIDPQRLFAINIGENVAAVQEHLAHNHYTFRVLLDINGEAASVLAPKVTPTLYLIGTDRKVSWASSGVGLTEVWRIEQHLR